jgi:signal transduction histidine kinase
VIHLEQCFHLVAGAQQVDDLITGGGYLITPGWLANWQQHIENMGFNLEQAAPFFQDFASELILLDTGIDTSAQQHIEELKACVNLPVRKLFVGLDHVRLMLNKQVLEWRLERQKAKSAETDAQRIRELADHISTMDMLTHLAKTQHETEAIEKIRELFQMLFAPAELYYLRVENEKAVPIGNIPDEIRESVKSLKEGYAWTADKKGFMLVIISDNRVMGQIILDRLAFPEHRDRYLNMALAITGICGLAIENARNRKKLLEIEKMASLGIVVAGVAHEINTPLGIGIAAASTLHTQTGHLAKQFSERKMTQSDLDNYLIMAQKEAQLLGSNLGRISQLVDSFRQVAVNGKHQENQLFNLNQCLNDVIDSLKSKLVKNNIELQLQCDPELEITSLVNDWVSIFTNLIDNSIKHGFCHQQNGIINIQIIENNGKLELGYSDNGQGIERELLEKIFDPFFTSNIQQGMGLGLHLVYNLITQRMSGNIQCDSQPGKGMHFFIEVPL